MPHLGVRIPQELYIKINHHCKAHGLTKSNYVIDLISANLAEIGISKSTDWRVEASQLFDITIGQVRYALNRGESAAEVLKHMSDKSTLVNLNILTANDIISIEIEHGNALLETIVKVDRNIEKTVKESIEAITKEITRYLEERLNAKEKTEGEIFEEYINKNRCKNG